MIIFLSYFSLKSNCKIDDTQIVEDKVDEEVIIKPKINKFLDYPGFCYDVQVFSTFEEKVKKNVTPDIPVENEEVPVETDDQIENKKADDVDERPKLIAYIVVAILLVSAVKAVFDVLKVSSNKFYEICNLVNLYVVIFK